MIVVWVDKQLHGWSVHLLHTAAHILLFSIYTCPTTFIKKNMRCPSVLPDTAITFCLVLCWDLAQLLCKLVTDDCAKFESLRCQFPYIRQLQPFKLSRNFNTRWAHTNFFQVANHTLEPYIYTLSIFQKAQSWAQPKQFSGFQSGHIQICVEKKTKFSNQARRVLPFLLALPLTRLRGTSEEKAARNFLLLFILRASNHHRHSKKARRCLTCAFRSSHLREV